MSNERKRVVVTGMGAVTPLGLTVDEYWSKLVKGKSGIAPITLFDATNYPCRVAGEVKDFDPAQYIDRKELRRMARFAQLAVAAAGMAIEDADLDLSRIDLERTGVLLGSGIGGLPTTEEAARIMIARGGMRMSPFHLPMILPNMAAANVSRTFGLKGYSSTVITACAAGNQGIGEATEMIRRGVSDVMLGGGCEGGICELTISGFSVMRALTNSNDVPEAASRPFDSKRDGFVPAEGAGVLILESLEHALDRGANIVAEIKGYGVSSDAFHTVQPDETGDGASRAVKLALKDAGIGPNDVHYINAHGTSTPINDHIETMAMKKVFGDQAYRIPISSTKSMTGHALGGAGALEAVACIKTIQTGEIHPTINHEFPDPECDLDYVPNVSRKQRVDIALSNSFGFGGQNACVVFGRYEG
jgi:3-oxoacyl-[acyl-carrier-protein] synthase II